MQVLFIFPFFPNKYGTYCCFIPGYNYILVTCNPHCFSPRWNVSCRYIRSRYILKYWEKVRVKIKIYIVKQFQKNLSIYWASWYISMVRSKGSSKRISRILKKEGQVKVNFSGSTLPFDENEIARRELHCKIILRVQ